VGIDHDAVADETDDAGVQNARRDQVQHELAAAHIHGVPRIVPALVARDERELRREQIDDLAFPFVAPLGAEHAEIHEDAMIP
jgi:hypothetical protein